MDTTKITYSALQKPSWAPPSWLFGPVWSVLYILIAISYGRVVQLYLRRELPLAAVAPFALNLVFNLIYTPIQFKLKNYPLASLDIFLVLGTIVWMMIAIWPYERWVVYANIPYLVWVAFATVLQVTITLKNL